MDSKEALRQRRNNCGQGLELARHEAEAILVESAEHLRKALKLLDGGGLKLVVCAQISHSLEDLRQEIHMLRMASQSPPPLNKSPSPHALG